MRLADLALGSPFGITVTLLVAAAIGGAVAVNVLRVRMRRPPEAAPRSPRPSRPSTPATSPRPGAWPNACSSRADLSTDDWGGPDFILGLDAVRAADHASEKEQPEHYRTAATLLQKAYGRGFPPGREGEGLYQLARCLQLSGSVAASCSVLETALETELAAPGRAAPHAGRGADGPVAARRRPRPWPKTIATWPAQV